MYYTYILRCTDDSLYTGITTDLARRMEEHRSKGAKSAYYTRSHTFEALEAAFESESRQTASRLEYLIKKLPKSKKEALIKDTSMLSDILPVSGADYKAVSMEKQS